MDAKTQLFVGTGLTYPFTLNNGRVELSSGAELIKSNLKLLLTWHTGTRFFMNEYGSTIESLLEEPNPTILDATLTHHLLEITEKWMPKIQIEAVKAKRLSFDTVNLLLIYSLKNSSLEDTIELPFYKNA